ncbi:MAG: peptidylprolyl isomerase, partial [Verrucomicrobia bacterium]|nr:peptidylprolyl isomerase [Verrucomicrobiota bacterium]
VGEVEIMTLSSKQQYFRQYPTQVAIRERKIMDARNENVDELVKRQLILRDFKTTFGTPERLPIIDKEINKEVDQELDAEIRSHYGGSRMTLIQSLQAEGITLERHRQQIRDRILITWMRQKNIGAELIVSPHRVQVYYDAHREEFRLGEEVKLRMIVLNCPKENEVKRTERLAEDILIALKGGATFAEMATIYHEGSQRGEGGDWGWCKTGPDKSAYEKESKSQRLKKGWEDTAISLPVGKLSGVMSRSDGPDYWVCQYSNGVPVLGRHYVEDAVLNKEMLKGQFDNAAAAPSLPPPIEFFLMLVEEKRPERFAALNEVRERIEKEMLSKERIRLEKQWVQKLKDKTFVRTF